jgi:hypothetical protein
MSAESQQRQPLLRNGSTNIPVAWHWLGTTYITAATHMHTTTDDLLEVVFSVWSALGLYNKD